MDVGLVHLDCVPIRLSAARLVVLFIWLIYGALLGCAKSSSEEHMTDRSFGLFEPDALLPAQFYAAFRGGSAVRGEKRLM